MQEVLLFLYVLRNCTALMYVTWCIFTCFLDYFCTIVNRAVICCGCWHLSQVKLKDSVVSALRFCKAKEIELAWIDALLDLSHAKTDTSCVTDGNMSDSKGTEIS